MSKKKQLDLWLKPNKGLRLLEIFGDYDEFQRTKGDTGTGKRRHTKRCVFEAIELLLEKHNNSLELLEVGCGPGHFIWSFKDKVSKIVGLDYSPIIVKLVEEQFKKSNTKTEFVVGTCWELPFSNDCVDIAIQIDVCMHIGGSWDAIKEMIRVARKYVIFTGPSFEHFDEDIDKQLGPKVWAVSIPLLENELDKLCANKEINKYQFLYRKSVKTFKHRILFIEK